MEIQLNAIQAEEELFKANKINDYQYYLDCSIRIRNAPRQSRKHGHGHQRNKDIKQRGLLSVRILWQTSQASLGSVNFSSNLLQIIVVSLHTAFPYFCVLVARSCVFPFNIVIESCIEVQTCIVCIHVNTTFSVIPRPRVRPPFVFSDHINTCSKDRTKSTHHLFYNTVYLLQYFAISEFIKWAVTTDNTLIDDLHFIKIVFGSLLVEDC
ncbi:unnamed protein product [Lepeophtheirus salmonis]|uniref:(salmon louse) hypothetical protein n=1 Tax=Lepeophtheirus salmonis TaxID=72036 RepID=A0A7R8CLZ6_LEPSM|nr:unnamed protein product [Lepeophtheirus salmonis]CAF2817101.1 unnamed protein product [Lepeophtheirus salmonis]